MKKIVYTFVLFAILGLETKAQIKTLYNFANNDTSGKFPYYASLYSDGTYLYGMTAQGGKYSEGTIFKIKPDGTAYDTLHSFANNSANPAGSLISDGTYLYGMTQYGGLNYGTIFEIKPDGTGYTNLYNFANNSTSGRSPLGALYYDGTYLYGTTNEGGANNEGTVFKIMPNGTNYTHLYDFAYASGIYPCGSLISDGTYLYGTTAGGGGGGQGTVFKIEPNGTNYSLVYSFANNTTSGSNPFGSLISDGTYLYGLTRLGGANGDGTIFKIMPNGSNYVDLYDFAGNATSGQTPDGTLVSDGTYLYGVTSVGGANNQGTIFKIKPDGSSYIDLADFNTTNGAQPCGSLVIDGNYLYGMTRSGGLNADGTVFSYATYGAALNFDGNNDYISISDNTMLDFGTGDFTIEASFQSNVSQPGYAGLVSKASISGWAGFQLVIVNNNIAAEFSQGSSFLGTANGLQGSTNLTDGNWHHIAMVVNRAANNIKLLVDGNIEADVTDPAIATMNVNTSADMHIGTERTGGAYINGNEDEVRLWNRALCQGEIQNNMNAELPMPQTGLVAYYKFNQGIFGANNSGITTANDSSGNGNNGTLNNFTLNGTTSNWIAPGAVTSGLYASTFATPTITVSGNMLICAGATTTLTAGGADTYTWSTSDNTASIAVTPTANASYSVSGTSLGCITNTIISAITVNALPVISSQSGNTHTCEGGDAVFNVTSNAAGDTYQWNWVSVTSPNNLTQNVGTYQESGYTTNSMTISPMTSNTWGPSGVWGILCVVTNTNNCTANSVVDTIFINPLPTLPVSGGAICLGQSFTFSPSGVTSFTVSGGNSVITPTATTSYSITGTDGNGCVNNPPAVVTVTVSTPQAGFTYSLTTCCNDAYFTDTTHITTGDPIASWNWTFNGGAPTSSNSQTPPTVYLSLGTNTVCLKVTTALGCVDSTCSIVVETIAGINKVTDAIGISIYPNPGNGDFTIKTTTSYVNTTKLIIYNSLGQAVYTTTLNNILETIHTNLEAGMYTVRLENVQGIVGMQHLIITK